MADNLSALFYFFDGSLRQAEGPHEEDRHLVTGAFWIVTILPYLNLLENYHKY